MKMITYDLRQPGRDYSTLYSAIKELGSWGRPAESVWIIQSNAKCSEIRDHLQKFIDYNDVLFVCTIGEDWASYNIPIKVSDWLLKPVYLR